MFTPTLRCQCAQPASDRLMRKWCIGYREPKQFLSKWPRWFFLVHWNTFLPQSKQNSKFLFFAFLQVPMGVCGIFRPRVQGGSNELISKFLSSTILYNHPSYFKSGEINSCRLSPLPNKRHGHCRISLTLNVKATFHLRVRLCTMGPIWTQPFKLLSYMNLIWHFHHTFIT